MPSLEPGDRGLWSTGFFIARSRRIQRVPLAVGLGLILFLGMVAPAWGQDLEIGRPAPEFALKDRGFVVVAVSLDTGPRSAVEAFVKELGLTFPVLLDPRGGTVQTYRLPGVPASFLIDRRGRLVARELGPRDWNAGEARAQLEALLK